MKKIYIFLFLTLFLVSFVSAFPCKITCASINTKILNGVWDSRLKGNNCDCTTNTPINSAKVELFCFDVSGKACWNKIQKEACVTGCAYLDCQPNWINRQEGLCQTNNKFLISYTDSNSCGKNENLPSDYGEYSCDYCQQNIIETYSDWSICSPDDTTTKTKYYVDLNYNSCCALTGLSSDCEINSPVYENSTEIVSCDFCTPNIIQTNGTCMINDTLISSFNDSNLCYEKTLLDSDKIIQNQILSCDFCTPNWTKVKEPCQQDESISIWFNDTNACFEKTGLSSDINLKPNNQTLLFACDFDKNGFIGNISNINTLIVNISLKENNKTFNFKENNKTLFHFDFNLSQGILNLANIFIKKQPLNTSFSYFIIRGLNLTSQNKTKTIYFDRIMNGTGICIKDDEIESIENISLDCKGENEYWLSCPGNSGDYSCNLTENKTQYIVAGLKHSGIKEQETYCGDGICNGEESCSSCSADCGACPVETGSSSSGGGSGGGSSVYIKTIQNQTNNTANTEEFTLLMNETDTDNNETEYQETERGFIGITGAVIGATIKDNLVTSLIFITAIVGTFIYLINRKKVM